ncbi:predicted protein [Thalassiosira pseudonana CCMP1335]|uniref:Uncharacterized protein n=1 Tax=Thalassiosira pseudonana TaxID=35128 RepID=B8LE72_THAPS|nr:predicted protein [Thalassiosira pseudonana CCMP1335]EED86375.1 predicted protein [Thalassiosira pseudonana CCMP1335]
MYFDTDSNPSMVHDDHHNLVCYYARQMITVDITADDEKLLDTKENKCFNVSTRATDGSSAPSKEDFWYFFSPLYFGESPVACIASPRTNEKVGQQSIEIYTFKRKYDGQPVAKRSGYFGERIYNHGIFTQNDVTGKYELFHNSKWNGKGCELDTPNKLVLSSDESGCGISYWIYSKLFATSFEFYKPGSSSPEAVLTIDEYNKSIKVTEGSDVIESICLWCALCMYLGKTI